MLKKKMTKVLTGVFSHIHAVGLRLGEQNGDGIRL